jgi:hypothetical protein
MLRYKTFFYAWKKMFSNASVLKKKKLGDRTWQKKSKENHVIKNKMNNLYQIKKTAIKIMGAKFEG